MAQLLMEQRKQELIETWVYYNEKSKRFLSILSDEQLKFKPFKHSKSLGYMLNHLGDVHDIYVRVLEEKHGISWDEKKEDELNEVSVVRLKSYFQEVDERYNKVIQSINLDAYPGWEDMGNPNYGQCIQFLIEHEIHFHGILRMYVEGMELDFNFRL